MPTLPGLLLFHGVGDSGECWEPFLARLRSADDGALADLVVSTPNAPAHGGRPAAPNARLSAPDQLSAALGHATELVARTGRPIVVGGHSMGSAIALAVAAARPDLTCGLWLEDPPFTRPMASDDRADPNAPVDVSEFGAWFAALQRRPLSEVVAGARVEHPGWDPGEYEPWARAKQAVDVDAFAEPVVWIGAGWARRARSIRVPTVVVAGVPAEGSIVDPTAAAELAALPLWTVHRLPTGHDVRRDAPAVAVQLLAALLQSVAP